MECAFNLNVSIIYYDRFKNFLLYDIIIYISVVIIKRT